MSRENQPEHVVTIGGTPIMVQIDVTYYPSFCRGCGDEQDSYGFDYDDQAGVSAIQGGFRYLEDGPNGPGNYCQDCRETIPT